MRQQRIGRINILGEIAEKTRERISEKKRKGSTDFENALTGSEIKFICEVKKASPSLGIICEDFDYIKIAEDYESAGAAAISVLTEPFYFHGRDEYLTDISRSVKLPLLRKDFIVDEYMIYEAKFLGASAVLLICAVLDDAKIKKYIETAGKLGLAVLTETHDEMEVKRALDCGARIIGVNNRDLKTFEVDIKTSERLKKYVPDDIIFVSESGIKTRDDVKMLEDIGAHAVLVGETLMRSGNIKAELAKLRGLIL